jgi:SAM-dependent methyltransferase
MSEPAPVLTPSERSKLDDSEDTAFYDQPRFVHHVDEAFRSRLTDHYRRLLSPGDRVLDLMGSWVSHLPDLALTVTGHGLNEAELAENDRYEEWFVQDLNAEQALPFADERFDAVLCAVSVQYLQYPARVFAEVARVLAPGGFLFVSFSNRMFPTKAVRAWRNPATVLDADTTGDAGGDPTLDARAALVRRYLDAAGGFDEPTVHRHVVSGQDPFYAVEARRASDDGTT